jgi:hypothetical protein
MDNGDELKRCPLCGREVISDRCVWASCINQVCELYGNALPREVWQALGSMRERLQIVEVEAGELDRLARKAISIAERALGLQYCAKGHAIKESGKRDGCPDFEWCGGFGTGASIYRGGWHCVSHCRHYRRW